MSDETPEVSDLQIKAAVAKIRCEESHLFFTRFFFKARNEIKFRVNWHHEMICEAVDSILDGTIKNLVINVAPGSSKTELVVINLIARGLAKNPRARFLHLSGSDTLASLNSSTARDIVVSDEFQRFWPMKIADDSKSQKRWNVMVGDNKAGGVYATAIGGQVTGFRAGHMVDGFQGAIIIDDPLKPEDAFSKPKVEAANRKLLTTVMSRRANPSTPIILIMQRLGESDATGFIEGGNVPGEWTFLKIPAMIDDEWKAKQPKKWQKKIKAEKKSKLGKFSYWEYKEPIAHLIEMSKGRGTDQNGQRISRHVFNSQMQQEPRPIGGNIIKGHYFKRFKVPPKLKFRFIYGDTAQKTKERNDFSVFGEFGISESWDLYLLDLVRGKWEAPELQSRLISFWAKAKARESDKFGQLRKVKIEDKSSGTGLIQSVKLSKSIPIEGIERVKDKLTRVMDSLPYLESGQVWVPEDAPFTNDLILECEAFTADDSHKNDDQVDVLVDAINDLLSNSNKLKQWAELANSKS